MSRVVFAFGLIALAASAGCRSPYHSDRGAAAGALLGGATGAVIGNQSGNTAEGALVGGAVGALTGALVGDGIDQAEERNRRYIDAQVAAQQARGTMSVDELITLTQQGVADEVIIAQINNQGMAHPVQTPDIIRMQQAGVSSAVMTAAQRKPAPPPVVQTVAPPPVIVEERVYGPPFYCGPHSYHYHPYRRPARVGFGFHYHH